VKHRLDFRISGDLRTGLLSLCKEVGLSWPDGTPRLAEAVRVLLISALRSDDSSERCLTAMLQSNILLGVSRHLAVAVAGLQDEVAHAAARVGGLAGPVVRRRSRVKTSAERAHPAEVISVALDRDLREALQRRLRVARPPLVAAGARRPASPVVALVRSLLHQALDDVDRQRGVLCAYAQTSKDLEAAIAAAVERSRGIMAAALRTARKQPGSEAEAAHAEARAGLREDE
jgi:hypothetical protein